jgi:hypothetical protein
MIVTLTADELTALDQQTFFEPAPRGYLRFVGRLQRRSNRKTHRLELSARDIDRIKSFASNPNHRLTEQLCHIFEGSLGLQSILSPCPGLSNQKVVNRPANRHKND